MRYRLAAIDLDNTLIDADRNIHPDNRRALDLMRERGILPVLASGRRYESMLPYHRALDLSGPIVTCQGAEVRSTHDDGVWFRHFLPGSVVRDVIEYGERHGFTAMCYAVDATVVARRNAWVDHYERLAGIRTRVDRLENHHDSALKIILCHDPERVLEHREPVGRRHPEHIQALVTQPYMLEVLSSGVHKATGVGVVAKTLGVAREEVLAFGDGDNDVELLAWAGLGVAMSECTPAARAAARFQAPDGPPASSFARAVRALL